MITIDKQKSICLKYNCWLSNHGYLYYFKDLKPKRIGKLYYRDNTLYYHIMNNENKNPISGDIDFEKLLLNYLNYLNLI